MPTYDYQCNACKTVFEYKQGFNDEKLTICPLCDKSGKITRLIGNGMFVFAKGDPTNIMSLADSNTKKLGKSYIQDRAGKKHDAKQKALKDMEDKTGGKVIRKSGDTPWWRNGSVPGTTMSEKPIDTSKISNIRKFIETGEK